MSEDGRPQNEIKQANRKALPKFLLTLVIACIGGGVRDLGRVHHRIRLLGHQAVPARNAGTVTGPRPGGAQKENRPPFPTDGAAEKGA